MQFEVEQINDIYGLPNVEMVDFEEKICDSGIWMAERLYPGKEVPWAATKRGISINDFTVEARIWLNIICSQIFPCTHLTVVTDLCSHMVACILDDISLNIGQLIISDMKFYKNHDGTHILFLSLSTELCKRVRVMVYPEDTWVCPGTPSSL